MNKIKKKFFNLLETYREEVSEANYPYSEKANQYPEHHPFENAPALLLDDEDFMLSCFELDYGECFKFCSYRLRNKKDFVMSALTYANPGYDDVGENLKIDFDILKSLKIKDFSKFGYEILRDKKRLVEIIKKSHSKDFFNHEWLPPSITNDKNFFLKIIDNSYNSEICLKWANNSIKRDFDFINKCISKNAKSIKFVSKNTPKFDKLVFKAISKDGELLIYCGKKYLQNEKYILQAANTYGEIYKYIHESKKNVRKIALKCLLKKPQMLKFANSKIKSDKKLIIKLIKKDCKCFKYINKKIKTDYKILKSVILNTSFSSGDEYKHAAIYLSKLGNRNLIKFAVNKDQFWFSDLSNKYKNDKEIALITIKKSNYAYKDVSEKLKKDKDILEAATKNFFKKSNDDINDHDNISVSLLHRDLYWHIFYKVNPHKIDKKEYVEFERVMGEGIFDYADKVHYTGDMLHGRPHGEGYATNEESEWADAAVPSTYKGEWLNGLPHGKGELKDYEPNHFPPNGKIMYHYIGNFVNGKKHDVTKEFSYNFDERKSKWRKVRYKFGKMIK